MTTDKSYWIPVPRVVQESRSLSSDEKDMYSLIARNLCEGGYCRLSNEELASKFKVTIRTITSRLSSMKKKGYISITLETHNHARRIYTKVPGEPTNEPKPTEKDLEPKTRRFQESLKKAIVFGTIDFSVLVEKMLESPYLEHVEENDTQFILNLEQIRFLANFMKFNKKIDCQIAMYPNVDLQKLMESIRESAFLMQNSNLNLKWMLENADKIINGDYKSYIANMPDEDCGTVRRRRTNFTEREYTREELFSLFKSVDEIEI